MSTPLTPDELDLLAKVAPLKRGPAFRPDRHYDMMRELMAGKPMRKVAKQFAVSVATVSRTKKRFLEGRARNRAVTVSVLVMCRPIADDTAQSTEHEFQVRLERAPTQQIDLEEARRRAYYMATIAGLAGHQARVLP